MLKLHPKALPLETPNTLSPPVLQVRPSHAGGKIETCKHLKPFTLETYCGFKPETLNLPKP